MTDDRPTIDPDEAQRALSEALKAAKKGDGDAVRWAVSDLARLFADATGQRRLDHAAAVAAAEFVGRPRIDDSAAMRRVEELEAAGKGRTAVGTVARSMATDPADIHAIAQRLRARRRSRKTQ